jgi:uncharacterized membrane protein YfcA
MWLEGSLYLVPCIVMIAACTRSTFGFGDALLAMPLLLALLEPESATVVMAGVSLVQGALMLWQERREIDLKISAHLLCAAMLGVPCGLLGVQMLPANVLRLGVSVVLIAYATQGLFKVQLPELKGKGWSMLAGFGSGFLGASVNISGPPVVLYGTMARWRPERFRATLQGFFLPLGVVIVGGQILTGMWTPERLTLMGVSMPAMLCGLWIGITCRGRIAPHLFAHALHIILVAIAGLLAYHVWTTPWV